ncbi:MAG: 2-oxoacid:acceptor oxidoreductase subunit alpha [Candidatus Roizmanbacteria bacterium]|nr:MAG: 2-oxoacid:acceptor oxidoreductase subunit alpha [Candidatus Roizmanbacteria bacterium]
MTKFLWKIGGEAGFGIMTSGVTFAKIATRSGYHIFDYAEYPSLVRGGHNTYEVLFSEEEVFATQKKIDLLICLNQTTYDFHKSRLDSNSLVVYDNGMFEINDNIVKVHLPFKSILQELNGQQVMMNTIVLGATMALLEGDINLLYSMIEEQFQRKGKEVVDYNKQFAQKGYEYIKNNHPDKIKSILIKKDEKEKLVMTGNESFSLGTVTADCRLYAAYPMTPASSILTVLAQWQNQTGMIVRHAEDEIAVINTALGSSQSGARSAVGTSGGGFALMTETISFSGTAELPLVIFLGQRPGPATGMPTWTEQGDLLFACYSGHGEFPKIVLAPGDIDEMLKLTVKAFDLADIYQVPVIILADKLLCESHKSLDKEQAMSFMTNYQPNRGKTVCSPTDKPYLRYKLSDDGISERLIPGVQGSFYQSNSYEHIEDGHTTEQSKPRFEQVNKRGKKINTYLTKDFDLPAVYGDVENANIVFVSWGSNKGAILEAQKILYAQGTKSAFIHFTHVYPIDSNKVNGLFSKDKRYILIENNSQAQFGQLLRMQTGVEIKEKFLKYDGRPVWVEEIVDYIKKH